MKTKRKYGLARLIISVLATLGIAACLFLFFVGQAHPAPETPAQTDVTTSPSNAVPGYTAAPSDTSIPLSDENRIPDYYSVTEPDGSERAGDLILVNGAHAYDFDVNHPELVTIASAKTSHYQVKDDTLTLSDEVMPHLNAMMDDFYAATGKNNVIIISAYRSYDYQQTVYDEKVAEVGAASAGDWAQLPGYSEHHTGLAFDFGIVNRDGSTGTFTGTGDYAWIAQNAYRYGFILRYQADKKSITGIDAEPWHFRYVGVPSSYIIQQRGFCYEEYIDFIKSYTSMWGALSVDVNGVKYELFYSASSTFLVPRGAQYTVSGTNDGGYIVTMRGGGGAEGHS